MFGLKTLKKWKNNTSRLLIMGEVFYLDLQTFWKGTDSVADRVYA